MKIWTQWKGQFLDIFSMNQSGSFNCRTGSQGIIPLETKFFSTVNMGELSAHATGISSKLLAFEGIGFFFLF